MKRKAKTPAPKKRARGRPRGSSTRGPTVPTTLRLSLALDRKIERIRRESEELWSKTQVLERLLTKGIEAESKE